MTNYILIVKRILLFFSVLREKIIISNFRSNQTLKGKGQNWLHCSCSLDKVHLGPCALTITEILGREDTIRADPSAVQAGTRNTRRHM